MGTDIHELSGKAEGGFGFRYTFESFSNSVDSLYYACQVWFITFNGHLSSCSFGSQLTLHGQTVLGSKV